jgi:hypothetical protein
MFQQGIHSFFNGKPFLDGMPARDACQLNVEEHFRGMLAKEQKRTVLLNSPFLLMLIDVAGLLQGGITRKTFKKLLDAINHATRETDIKGWYETNRIMGIIFTEIEKDSVGFIVNKISAAIAAMPDSAVRPSVRISHALFPDDRPAPQPGCMKQGAPGVCQVVS